MNRTIALTLISLMLLVFATPVIDANSSGKYNSASGCSCHYSGSSPTISHNIPTAYDAGQQYTLNISVSSSTGQKGGFSLEVNKGTLSAPGVGIGAVKVNSAGSSATHTTSNNRAWTLAWTAPATGSGSVTFGLACMAANGNGGTGGDSWTTTSVTVPETPQGNQPPSASNALLSPTTAKTADQLSLTYNFNDPDADQESGSVITWFKDGSIVTSQNGLNTLSSSLTTKGEQWQVSVIPSDGTDQGDEIFSNVVTIQNTAPVAGTPTLTPGNPDTDSTIAIIQTNSDVDNDQLTVETRWFLDGSVVNSLNDLESLPAYATRSGDVWFAEVRISDGEAITNWERTNSVTIGSQNAPPIIESATLIPISPKTTDEISLSYTSTDPDSDTVQFTEIMWYKNDNLVPILNDLTAVPVDQTAAGEAWKAQVRVSDGQAWSDWFWSDEVIVVNTNPVAKDLVIAQQLFTTEDIEVSFDLEDVDNHQLNMEMSEILWTRNNNPVQSMNGQISIPSTMTTKGDIWKVTVRVSDGYSLSDNTVSGSVEIVNSAPQVTAQLPESITSDQNLVLTLESKDSDSDTVEYQINWYRNGFKAGQFANLTEIESQFLGPGQTWSVEVTASDGTASTTANSAQTLIENILPTPVISVLEDNLWRGEVLTLSAELSSDQDGLITNAIWSWSDSNGNSGQLVGLNREIILNAPGATISLTVIDDAGGKNTTSRSITLTSPPSISNFYVTIDGVNANLNWDWTGPAANFHVYRDGVLVAVVDNTSFMDSPDLAGTHTWAVSAIVDGVELGEGNPELQSSAELDLTSLEETGSTSATSGLILGIFFVVLGFGGLLLALSGGREE